MSHILVRVAVERRFYRGQRAALHHSSARRDGGYRPRRERFLASERRAGRIAANQQSDNEGVVQHRRVLPAGNDDKQSDATCVNAADSIYGDAGRNILEGPGQVTVDMSLNKTITIKEYRSLDLRITANNIFNMVNFSSLGTVVNSTNFGEVTGAGTMRRVTVQARFRF